MQDDVQLVYRAAKGDRKAFEELVALHADRVFRTAYQWCGNRADAEDITQEVFVKLARIIHSFGGRAKFSTWLYKVTVNEVRNHQKKDGRRQGHETEYARQDNEAVAPAPDAEKKPQLAEMLGRLPPEQREAVVLVFCDGLTHKDAAKALGCAEKTVTWRIFEAKKKLTEWYSHG